MIKAELYNKIVDLYKKTGQGTPTFVGERVGMDLVYELVEDGLVKIVTQPFSHLPDSKWICLTKGYCVEEDEDKALTFLRMYLAHDPVINLGNHTLTLADSFRKPDFVQQYSEWLTKNHKALEEMKDIEYLEMGDGSLSESDTEYLKTRGWYKENEIISVCINRLDDADPKKMLSTLNEMIKLKQSPSVAAQYAESVKEDIKERDEIPNTIRIRKRVRNWLDIQDENVKIQSLF